MLLPRPRNKKVPVPQYCAGGVPHSCVVCMIPCSQLCLCWMSQLKHVCHACLRYLLHMTHIYTYIVNKWSHNLQRSRAALLLIVQTPSSKCGFLLVHSELDSAHTTEDGLIQYLDHASTHKEIHLALPTIPSVTIFDIRSMCTSLCVFAGGSRDRCLCIKRMLPL